MKRDIRIISDTGEQWLTHLNSEERRDIGSKDLASLYVPRDEISPGDIEEGRDRAELIVGGVTWFAGPIEDVIRDGAQLEIIVESPERYSERAEPTDGVEEYDNIDDDEIVAAAIEDTPELEAGSMETTNPHTSLLFSHSSQAYKARKTEEVSPGILRFNPDLTVDYGSLGRNKSHVTLSPRRDNVHGEPEVERKSSYENVTHLRMLGAGEGPHQIRADAVSSDYEAGDDQIWKVYPDKSIVDAETLQTKADHYVDELSTRRVEVDMTVKGLAVDLGDLFRVYVPKKDVDQILQIVSHKRIVDTEGIRHEITASNHRDTRETPSEKNQADLSNYNQALEGNSVPINTSGGRQPVDSENPYELQLYYPSEVAYEHRLNVRAVGLPYRAYSAGALDNADFTSQLSDDSGLTSNELQRGSWRTIETIDFNESLETSTFYVVVHFYVPDFGESHSWGEISFRYLKNGQTTIPDSSKDDDSYQYRLSDAGNSVVFFADPTDMGGESFQVQARLDQGARTGVDIVTNTMMIAAGKHTHDPDPGIIEEFGEGTPPTVHYPTNCQVIVNGEAVGDLIEGDSDNRWNAAVDIRSLLDEGTVNRIEVESDTLGHMQCYIEGDVYRQIAGRG